MRIPDAIHEELKNWERACHLGPWPHPLPATHCGSLESQYRPPDYWNQEDAEEAMRKAYVRPNMRHAQIVQEVWADLPTDEKMILQAEYPARWKYRNRTNAAAVLGYPMWLYEAALSSAVTKVGESFAVRA